MSRSWWEDGWRAERTREVRTLHILSSNEHCDLVVAAPVEELLETLDQKPLLAAGKQLIGKDGEGLQERILKALDEKIKKTCEEDVPFAPKKIRTEEAKSARALGQQKILDGIIGEKSHASVSDVFKIPTLRAKMPIDAPPTALVYMSPNNAPSCISSPDPHSRPE